MSDLFSFLGIIWFYYKGRVQIIYFYSNKEFATAGKEGEQPRAENKIYSTIPCTLSGNHSHATQQWHRDFRDYLQIKCQQELSLGSMPGRSYEESPKLLHSNKNCVLLNTHNMLQLLTQLMTWVKKAHHNLIFLIIIF